MDLRQLRYFARIVELGSITRAAESLNLAQPALSQQVAVLEASLHAKLLARSSKGTQPTEAGRILYRHANSVLRQLDQARVEIERGLAMPSGRVSIGLPGSVAHVIAVPLLQALRIQMPDVVLEISEGSNRVIAEMLANGRIDLAVLSRENSAQGMTVKLLAREELFLAFSPGAALEVPDKLTLDLADLAGPPLILPGKDTPKRIMVEAALGALGLAPRIAAELAATATTVAAAEAGIGCALLSWAAVRESVQAGRLVLKSIGEPRMMRPLGLCVTTAVPHSRAAMAVSAQLEAMVVAHMETAGWQRGP